MTLEPDRELPGQGASVLEGHYGESQTYLKGRLMPSPSVPPYLTVPFILKVSRERPFENMPSHGTHR